MTPWRALVAILLVIGVSRLTRSQTPDTLGEASLTSLCVTELTFLAVPNATFQPSMASAHSDEFQLNITLNYTCNVGFNQTGGDSILKCAGGTLNQSILVGTRGVWIGTPIQCILVVCGPPPFGERSMVSFENDTYDSIASYKCLDGYTPYLGNTSSRCQADQMWSGIPLSCRVPDCGNPPQGIESTVTWTNTTLNNTAGYNCNDGYNASAGDVERTCLITENWSGSALNCTIVDCGVPERGNNTNVSMTATTFDSIVLYSCAVGYEAHGYTLPLIRQCQANGTWNSTALLCTRVSCGAPPVGNFSVASTSGTLVGAVAQYSCREGYTPVAGNSIRLCAADGVWSEEALQCTPVVCGFPPAGGFSNVSFTDVEFGSITRYTCFIGSAPRSGNEVSTCQANSTWSGSPLFCQPVDCGNLANSITATVSMVGTTYLSVATYTCRQGYTAMVSSGNNHRVCQADGQWSGVPLSCNVVNCSAPDVSTGSTVSGNTFTYNSTVDYTCALGYNTVGGSATRRCLDSGAWSGSALQCQIVNCGTPEYGLGSNYTINSTTYGSIALYSCLFGHIVESTGSGDVSGSASGLASDRSVGYASRQCKADGTWSGAALECRPVDCGNLVDGYNARVSYTSTAYESRATYTCVEGHENSSFLNNQERVCLASGNWSEEPLRCTIVDCRAPDQGRNSNYTANSTVYDSTALYVCDIGHRVEPRDSNDASRQCQANGLWSGSPLDCTPVDCGNLTDGYNARVAYTTTTYRSSANYSCLEGHTISSPGGNQERRCQANGSWSDEPLRCTIVDCGTPEQGQNSNYTADSTTYNSTAFYQCDIGHEVDPRRSSNASRQCKADGTWGGSPLDCTPISCGHPGVFSNGFIAGDESYRYSTSVQYECRTGYALNGPESRTCLADKTWSPQQQPLCDLIHCMPLPTPANGRQRAVGGAVSVVGNHTLDQYLNFSCNAGYNLIGAPTTICTSSGLWTDPSVRRCEIVNCGNTSLSGLSSVIPGLETESLEFNTTVRYECLTGYNRSRGDYNRTCLATGSWSGQALECTVVDCGQLTDGFNATVTVFSTMYRGVANYTCLTGYNISSSLDHQSRVCQANGIWSGTPLQCTAMNCGTNQLATGGINATVSFSSTTYTSVATYACIQGYEPASRADGSGSGGSSGNVLDGSEVFQRTCQADGIWSGGPLGCSAINCGSSQLATAGLNATVDYSSTTFGSIASYTCIEGFEPIPGSGVTTIDGNKVLQRTCQANGTWSREALRCSAISCGHPGAVLNGQINGDKSYRYSTSVQYECRTGYALNGPESRTCLDNKTWSPQQQPLCDLIHCMPLPTPANGRQRAAGGAVSVVGNHTLDQYLNFSCNAGYNLIGAPTTICTSSGLWTDPSVRRCEIVNCGNTSLSGLSSVIPGLETESLEFNTTVRYECLTGHNKSRGDYERICLATGSWSGQALECTVVDCGQLTDGFNATVTVFSTMYRGVANYTCLTGYNISSLLDHQSSRVCQANGIWSGAPLQCTAINCGTSQLATGGLNATVSFSGTTYTSVATYACIEGYEPTSRADGPGSGGGSGNVLDGSEVFQRTCQADGIWSGGPLGCSAINCGSSQLVTAGLNATVDYSSTTFGSIASYTCIEGFEPIPGSGVTTIDGNKVWQRTCQANGTWSREALRCSAISCGHPGAVLNGQINGDKSYRYSTSVQYECRTGYALNGPESRTCLANKTWSPQQQPLCDLIHCKPLPTPANGRQRAAGGAVSVVGNHTLDQYLNFSCNAGYNLIGAPTTICTSSGLWTDPSVRRCEIVNCGNTSLSGLSSVIPGLETESLEFNTTVRYECLTGYNRSRGDYERICLATGGWSGQALECTVVDCGQLTDGFNATVTVFSTMYRGVANYTCLTGYNISSLLDHQSSRVCQANGIWSGAPLQCTAINCGTSQLATGGLNATVSFSGTTYTSVATYACIEGYEPTSRADGPGSGGGSGNVLDGSEVFQRTCQADGIWSGGPLGCSAINCGSSQLATAGLNAAVDYSSTTFGSIASYTCIEGFEPIPGSGVTTIDGNKVLQRTCQANGTWSREALRCSAISCGHPGAVLNGQIYGDKSYRYSTSVQYECRTGYALNGPESRTCLANKTWSPQQQPLCDLIHCMPLPTPANGRQRAVGGAVSVVGNHTLDQYLNFSCNTGYNLIGAPTTICTSSGLWTDPSVRRCEIVNCGNTSLSGLSSVIPGLETESLEFNTTVRYECLTGYNRSRGDYKRICLATGSWSGQALECTVVDCGQLTDGFNATVNVSTTMYRSVANYACLNGYNVSSSLDHRSRVCQANGIWSGAPLQCTAINCGTSQLATSGLNVTVSFTSTTYASVAMYTCIQGYEPASSADGAGSGGGDGSVVDSSGAFQRTCQADGVWSGESLSCSAVSCGVPANGTNSVASFLATTFRNTAQYTCFVGYQHPLSGQHQRVCQSDGEWSGMALECTGVYCGEPSIVQESVVSGGNGYNNFSSTLRYQCKPGYKLVGSEIRTCQEFGLWSTPPSCNIVSCDRPPDDGTFSSLITPGSQTYQSNAIYRCDTGYRYSSGDATRTCTASGSWSGAPLRCIIKTCSLANISNSNVFYTNGTNFGSVVSFTCNIGYDLNGTNQSSCNAEAVWTPEFPECQIADCGLPNSTDNTLYNLTSNATTYSASAVYACDDGYVQVEGSLERVCSENGMWTDSPLVCQDFDECHNGSHDCHDSAACDNTAGSYSCTCKLGYTGNGTDCADIDECMLNTHACDMAAECSNRIGSYACDCPAGFSNFNATACLEYVTYIGEILVNQSAGTAQKLADDLRTQLALSSPAYVIHGEKLRAATIVGSPVTYLNFDLRVTRSTADPNCEDAANFTGILRRAAEAIQSLRIYSRSGFIRCKDVCPAENTTEDERMFAWQATPSGIVAQISCTSIANANVTRTCTSTSASGAVWSFVNTNQCPTSPFTSRLLTLQLDNITASNAGNQSEELLSVVTSNNATRLSVTDLTVIADVVGAISTLELDQITTTQVFNNTIQTISNYMAANETRIFLAQMRRKASMRLLSAMDTLERSVARFVLVDGGTAPSFTSDRLQTAIVRGGSGTFASVTENELIVNSLAGDAKSHEAENSDKTDVEILLPETALPSSEMAVTVYRQYNSSGLFAGFDRSSLNQTLVGDLTAADSELLVNSRVVSASVYFSSEATEVKNLSGNITFRFRRIDDLNAPPNCSFWDVNAASGFGAWSQEGCWQVIETDPIPGFFKCQCNHLTNFAMLMSPYVFGEPNTAAKVLKYITYVGGTLSALALLATAVYPIFVKTHRSRSKLYLACLGGTMCAAYVWFMLSIPDFSRNHRNFCTFVGAAVYYFFLSSFCWMLVQAVNIYMAVAHVIRHRQLKNPVIKAALFSWGVPALLTIIIGAAHPTSFSREVNVTSYCGIERGDAQAYGFILPSLSIVATNTVLLIITLVKLRAHNITNKSLAEKKRKSSTMRARTIFGMTYLLGANWLVGILLYAQQSQPHIALQYIFSFITMIQGVVIFVFQLALNKEVRSTTRATWSTTTKRLRTSRQTGRTTRSSGGTSSMFATATLEKNRTGRHDYTLQSKEHNDVSFRARNPSADLASPSESFSGYELTSLVGEAAAVSCKVVTVSDMPPDDGCRYSLSIGSVTQETYLGDEQMSSSNTVPLYAQPVPCSDRELITIPNENAKEEDEEEETAASSSGDQLYATPLPKEKRASTSSREVPTETMGEAGKTVDYTGDPTKLGVSNYAEVAPKSPRVSMVSRTLVTEGDDIVLEPPLRSIQADVALSQGDEFDVVDLTDETLAIGDCEAPVYSHVVPRSRRPSLQSHSGEAYRPPTVDTLGMSLAIPEDVDQSEQPDLPPQSPERELLQGNETDQEPITDVLADDSALIGPQPTTDVLADLPAPAGPQLATDLLADDSALTGPQPATDLPADGSALADSQPDVDFSTDGSVLADSHPAPGLLADGSGEVDPQSAADDSGDGSAQVVPQPVTDLSTGNSPPPTPQHTAEPNVATNVAPELPPRQPTMKRPPNNPTHAPEEVVYSELMNLGKDAPNDAADMSVNRDNDTEEQSVVYEKVVDIGNGQLIVTSQSFDASALTEMELQEMGVNHQRVCTNDVVQYPENGSKEHSADTEDYTGAVLDSHGTIQNQTTMIDDDSMTEELVLSI